MDTTKKPWGRGREETLFWQSCTKPYPTLAYLMQLLYPPLLGNTLPNTLPYYTLLTLLYSTFSYLTYPNLHCPGSIMCVPHPGITCSCLLCSTLPQLYLSLSLDAAPLMCQTPLMNYVRHLNQFGTTVVVWYGKRAKFDRVCGTFVELNLGLTHGAPSESDVAPVLLQSQTYSIRFGT